MAHSVAMKKIFHTVTPDATFTFLSKESHEESKADDDGSPGSSENGFVYAESEVSEDEYKRLLSWNPEEGFDESLRDA